MKCLSIFVFGVFFSLFSYCDVLLYSDFEDGTIDNWVPKSSNECWAVSGIYALEGSKDLKAVKLDGADNIYAYTNVVFDLSNYDYEWQFLAKSAIANLTSGNTYWFWLAADKNDFNDSDIKGYVVGINYNGVCDDKLSVWKVNSISDVTKIIDSGITIGNDILSIKVTRSANGFWSLYYSKNASFEHMMLGGTAIETSFTSLNTTGPYFIFTASNSGKFRFDACSITRNSGTLSKPKILISGETNLTVTVNNELTFDVIAIVGSVSFGGLFSTNMPICSNFLEQTDDFPLTSTFNWTPDTVGLYTAIFTSTNEIGATTLIVKIEVIEQLNHKLWINELHYDNIGIDINEGVEICGEAGINLDQYTLYAYNGSGGVVYETVPLSGVIPNEERGYGAVWFNIFGLQNDMEGLALVKNEPEEVLYFISYQGSFMATDGPAAGINSVDIGVFQSGSKPADYSLQLKGSGSCYEDFNWSAPSFYSHSFINDGQTILSLTAKGAVLFIK